MPWEMRRTSSFNDTVRRNWDEKHRSLAVAAENTARLRIKSRARKQVVGIVSLRSTKP